VLRLPVIITAVAVAVGACGAVTSSIKAGASAVLSREDQQVVLASVQLALANLAPSVPVLLLDRTSTWTPTTEWHDDIPEEVRDEYTPRLPEALLVPTARPYVVGAEAPPSRAKLYDSARVKAAYQSQRQWRRLVKDVGGEPGVVEVGRPTWEAPDLAHVIVHTTAPWTRGGGTVWYTVERRSEAWVATLRRVLIVR
jgi:hypothetical protein